MSQMATYIKKLEAYGDNLEVAIIRTTKINKVLKGIIKLNSIPKDEEFHFRERSVKLLGVWNQLLGAEPPEDKPVEKEKESPTTTNGVQKEAEDKADEKIEKEVKEPEEKPVLTEEAVEKISADVPADAGEKVAATDVVKEDEKPVTENKTEGAASDATPAIREQAPESAAGAAEATEAVKATE